MKVPRFFLNCFGLFAILSVGNAYGSTELKSYKGTKDLTPLADSHYWANHPGQLPFEKCEFENPKFFNRPMDFAFLVYNELEINKESYKHPIKMNLNCWSEKLNTAFTIPFKFSVVGGGVSVGEAANFLKVHSVHRLTGKTVNELEGDYKGGGFAIGAIATGGGFFLKKKVENKKDLMMTGSMLGIGVEVSVAYIKARLVLDMDAENQTRFSIGRLINGQDTQQQQDCGKETPITSVNDLEFLELSK